MCHITARWFRWNMTQGESWGNNSERKRHSRCASLQSPATPPRDNTTAACTAACWENWRGTRVFGLNGGPKTRSDRLGLNLLWRKNLDVYVGKERISETYRQVYFSNSPSCFWNPWAPFTPWLYLYHKNTISGSVVGARQWNTFQTKQMKALQTGAKQQIKHYFILANKDCKKRGHPFIPSEVLPQHKST